MPHCCTAVFCPRPPSPPTGNTYTSTAVDKLLSIKAAASQDMCSNFPEPHDVRLATLTFQLPSLVGRIRLHDLGVDQWVFFEEVVKHAGSAGAAVAGTRLDVGVRRSAPTRLHSSGGSCGNSTGGCMLNQTRKQRVQ